MKQLLFLLLFPCLALAQYQGNANQKITLGEQTTADGLVFRGVASIDTVAATSKITRANKQDTSAFLLLDTVTNLLWHYKTGSNGWIQAGGSTLDTATMLLPYWRSGRFSGVLPVANGGTNRTTMPDGYILHGDGTSVDTSVNLFWDRTNSRLGIGTITPTDPLTISNGTVTFTFTPGASSGIFGTQSNHDFNLITAGNERFYIKKDGNVGVGTTTTDGSTLNVVNKNASNELVFRGTQYTNLISETTGGFDIGTSASSDLNLQTNGLYRMYIKSNGEIYVAGTTDRGSYNLQVNGTGVWGAGAYVDGSDLNIKDNIQNLDSSLYLINLLNPVMYNYKEEYNKDESKQIGFIAQDVYNVLANTEFSNAIVKSDGDTLSMAYSSFIPLLTKAIQEQQALIKALEQRILNLENK